MMLTRGSTRILYRGFPKEMDSKFMIPRPSALPLWKHTSTNPNWSHLPVNYTSMVFLKWVMGPTKGPFSILNLCEGIEKRAYRFDEISLKVIEDSRNNEPRTYCPARCKKTRPACILPVKTVVVVVESLLSTRRPVVLVVEPFLLFPILRLCRPAPSNLSRLVVLLLHPLTIVESLSRLPWPFLIESLIWLMMTVPVTLPGESLPKE